VVFKKVITWFSKSKPQSAATTPSKSKAPAKQYVARTPRVIEGATTIPRSEHPVSRKDISPSALKVLYRLKDNGYEAYLVGGCIRDILLGLEPKDFDVVTNATPEQVKRCFNNCRLIGRRFRLAHIMFGREIIEVATFRGHHEAEAEPEENETKEQLAKKVSRQSDEGQLLRDNVFGSMEEDAERRDFTINALYYDIRDFSIYDFANGMADIEKGLIDLIGEPETRYREDPVRMLRAIRFSNKLRMQIAERTEKPIFELAHLLQNIPPARLFDESLKLMLAGKAQVNYQSLRDYGLFRYFYPAVDKELTGNMDDKEERLLSIMFNATDTRINSGKSVSPAYILAAMFWYPLEAIATSLEQEGGLHPYDAFQVATNDVLQQAVQTIAIPKRFTAAAREIWTFQHRLTKTTGKRPSVLIENPRFRAAYDFLVLRAQVEGGELVELAQFWTDYQQSDEGKKHAYANPNQGKPSFKSKSPDSSYPKKKRKPRKYDKPKAKNQGS
jgi:poly(A) polymerase